MNQKQQVKIYQPNTTQIHNVILDYWMSILPNAEFKCLLAIARKTFGWQKKNDTITKKQIGHAAGLSNDTVRKAIRELEKRGLILCFENPTDWGINDPNTYEINVTVLNQNDEKSDRGLEINPPCNPNRSSIPLEHCSKPSGIETKRQGGVKSMPQGGVKSMPQGGVKSMPQGGVKSMPPGGVNSSPTKQSLTKPTYTKRQCPQPPIEIQTSGIGALPYSTSKKNETPSCEKIISNSKTLTEDQVAIAGWLMLQNIENAASETCECWAMNYPQEKITSAIDALQNEIAKSSFQVTDKVPFIQNFLDEKDPDENNLPTETPSKSTGRKKPLNTEQKELFALIKNENVEGATEDTITFWACNYQAAKLHSALQALQHEIKKGTQFRKSQAAFFRACLDGKIIPIDNTIQHNKEFAKKFAANKNWPSLKIFGKYIKDEILGDDLNLYMPHNQFMPALNNLYEKSKLYG